MYDFLFISAPRENEEKFIDILDTHQCTGIYRYYLSVPIDVSNGPRYFNHRSVQHMTFFFYFPQNFFVLFWISENELEQCPSVIGTK